MTAPDEPDCGGEKPYRYWNYRLIHHDQEPEGRQWIGLHEVHYQADEPCSWTLNATTFVCEPDEGVEAIIYGLEKALLGAKTKPLLLESELMAASRARHAREDAAKDDDCPAY